MNDKCVVLNAKRMNFDGKLDFSVLSSDVTVYNELLRKNAELFEEAFYEKKLANPPSFR